MSAAATVPMTWNQFVTQLATLAIYNVTAVSGVVQGTDTFFQTLLPQACNYAELRIQRDLDMLPSLTSNTYIVNSGNPVLQIDTDDFVTIQTINATANGVTTPLLPTSKEFIQNVYPTATGAGTPAYFAMIGGDKATGGTNWNNILLGPYPDATYAMTVFGTQRVPSLYYYATPTDAATGLTVISTYFADLMLMASMIYITGAQRQFGAQASDPAMAQSYESQYDNLLKGALTEEGRKKFSGSAWSSMSIPPAATPGR